MKFLRRIRTRLRGKGLYGILAITSFVPMLLMKRGTLSVDTKVYLYLDPGRLMRTALQMWDPQVGLGTVTHQTIGYLFPMGPYYWLMRQLGLPIWVAQRIWMGSLLFFAGAGVVYLLRTLRWRGPGVAIAAYVYLLSPYLLNYAAKHSVVASPWAGLPWMLAFTIRALRHRGWRDAALFAIVVQLIGGINATSLVFVLVGTALWVPFAVWVNREVSLRRALQAYGRITLLTFVTSLWWMSGLYAQGRFGLDILRFTETARTVASASTATEVLRGLGYWFFYGADQYGNFVQVGNAYTQHLWLLAVSFGLPCIGMLSSGVVRFRERAFFVALVLLGTALAVGAHPWTGGSLLARVFRVMLSNSQAGGAMRSMPRAVPLLVLGLAVLTGGAANSLAERWPNGRRIWNVQLPERRATLACAAIVLLAFVNAPALFTGQYIADNLQRPEDIPSYWVQDIKALDRGSHRTRVLEIPGEDFASYRWGTTVDPITPGLMDRAYVARELVPYGTLPSAQLVAAFDYTMQGSMLSPDALAPMARFMAAGDLNVRSDLTYERYLLVRPRQLWQLVQAATGLGKPTGFGGTSPNVPDPRFPLLDEQELGADPALPNPPKVAMIPVQDPENILKLASPQNPVVVIGDSFGLIQGANAGLLSGHELVFYGGTFADDTTGLRKQLARGATILLTDTNRKRGQRWGTVYDNYGYTETANEKLPDDPGNQPMEIFPGAGTDSQTVAQQRGGISATASDYGNPVTYTPEDRPGNAIDGDTGTSWKVGGFSPVLNESLDLAYAQPQSADHLRIVQPYQGLQDRFITKVALHFDDDPPVEETLTPASRSEAGQIINFPKRTFTKLSIEILATNIKSQTYFAGTSPVGIAELQVGDEPPRLDEVIRLPTRTLAQAGRESNENPLAIVLTRIRTRPSNAVRSDEELRMARVWSLPAARAFDLTGTLRISDRATDETIDRVLGQPDATAGGITATSSRHLAGSPAARASAAFDGDPKTAWTSGFLTNVGDWLDVALPRPTSFNHLDLQLVADGRHSVPTKLTILADGKPSATVQVPAVTDRATPNATVSVPLDFPTVTGTDIRVRIDAQRDVRTRDWYSGVPIPMPVAIAELGIPGVSQPAPTGPIDPACRSGLLTVDGKDVPVSLHGSAADAVARNPIPFEACTPPEGLALDAGDHLLRTATGRDVGIDIDQAVLRSAAGGAADPATGFISPTTDPTTVPTLDPGRDGRTKVTATVRNAKDPFWLVFGQSIDNGWKLKVNGKTLGDATLVNGYAAGWLIDPHGASTLDITLQWTPQRVVWIALGLSALALLACLALVLWPMRRHLAPVATEASSPGADGRASVPQPFEMSRLLRYAGPRPSARTSVILTLLSLLAWTAIIDWRVGLLVAVAAFLGSRSDRARPLLTLGAPAAYGAAAAYQIAFQLLTHRPVGFGWAAYAQRVHPLAWASVALLVTDVILDRLWLRRWWPSKDAEA